MNRNCWCLLVMKAKSPIDGKVYFFVDKCMPFGAAISCKIFQEFSDALSHIVQFRSGKENINYLDDFLFIAVMKIWCNQQLQTFIQICEIIQFPVALEKTEWASSFLQFLGLNLDGKHHLIRIPFEKINRALLKIQQMLDRHSKKSTLRELQSLCGFLNFLCKAIVPGRTFTRRMYTQGRNLTKPHHHFKIKEEFRRDLILWKQFLTNEKIFSRPFFDMNTNIHYTPQKFYTDASGKRGCGGICNSEWFLMEWDQEFLLKAQPSINYLELYAVTVGILSWVNQFSNCNVTLYCDNQSVIHMVNNQSSRNENCMVLLRILVLHCMIYNVRIKLDYVESKANTYADYLSRLKYHEFRAEAKKRGDFFNRNPIEIPECLIPMEKLWTTEDDI